MFELLLLGIGIVVAVPVALLVLYYLVYGIVNVIGYAVAGAATIHAFLNYYVFGGWLEERRAAQETAAQRTDPGEERCRCGALRQLVDCPACDLRMNDPLYDGDDDDCIECFGAGVIYRCPRCDIAPAPGEEA